ncbi:MAG: YggT family protein [Anaerolineales bacterium]
MIEVLVLAIGIFRQVLVLLILAKVIMSYFLSPYNGVRMMVDNLVEPLLAPIRRVLPTIGMFDFSPLVLIILVQLITGFLVSVLLNVR